MYAIVYIYIYINYILLAAITKASRRMTHLILRRENIGKSSTLLSSCHFGTGGCHGKSHESPGFSYDFPCFTNLQHKSLSHENGTEFLESYPQFSDNVILLGKHNDKPLINH